ncbi:MAG: DUF1990 domain-containing protein [Deltaproteobacteria bacterium]|nr:MAG: DUF1990 domain-containing protein [Deltaproteobacteria bacterium]TMQ19330.1 MAG: DUF1990 domain-containing protein [Deltaproteobacteria bacterium]
MWQLRRPTLAQVQAYRAAQRALPFSYPSVGATRDGGPTPQGFDRDRNRHRLGDGEAVFAAACAAVRAWQMFPPPLATIEPTGIPIAEGQVAAVVVRVLGVWFLNAARIVYVVDEPRRFGFAYGTLPGHAERGEERFLVEWLADDSVWYDLDALSRPRYWAARLAYPLTRRLQRRFARLSKAAMARAVARRCG